MSHTSSLSEGKVHVQMCRREPLPGPHQSIPTVGTFPLEEPLLPLLCREGSLCLTLQRQDPSSITVSSRNGSTLVPTKRRMKGAQGKSMMKVEIYTTPSRCQDALCMLPSVWKMASESFHEAVLSKKHRLPSPRGTRLCWWDHPAEKGTQQTVCS